MAELKSLAYYCRKPIPDLEGLRYAKESYRSYPINGDSPLHLQPLVDAQEEQGLLGQNHYWEARDPVVPGAIEGLWVRQSVANLLAAVDRQLRSWGYALFLKDAYRPLAVQVHIFQRIQARLKDNGLNAEMQRRRLAEWIAFPSDSLDSPPPHLTGGAVDLVLWSLRESRQCEMGKNKVDSGNAYPDALEHKSQTQALSASEEEGRVNRRILFWLMTHFGFAPNPTEYWHFSWGDQMWARLTGQPAAHYGPAPF